MNETKHIKHPVPGTWNTLDPFPEFLFSFILPVKLNLAVRARRPALSSGWLFPSLSSLLPSAPPVLSSPSTSTGSSSLSLRMLEWKEVQKPKWMSPSANVKSTMRRCKWWWAPDQPARCQRKRASTWKRAKYWWVITESLGGRTTLYWNALIYGRRFYREHALFTT